MLVLVARIPYPQPSEAVQHNPALCDLLEASGSQYLLTSLCSVSQYLVLKAVVSLSLLHSSWSEEKGNFLTSIHWCFFPSMQPREWWFPKTRRKGREAGRGYGESPLGEKIWVCGRGGQVCRKLVSGFSSRCVAQPCEQSEGNAHGVGSAGKKPVTLQDT